MPFPVYYAPMEGFTNDLFREFICTQYPAWDLFFSDFLRVPHQHNSIKEKHILEHYGLKIYQNEDLRKKNVFQILTSEGADHVNVAKLTAKLNLTHLNLNLGCPSKRVCQHKGGSFLLSDLNLLTQILREIRDNYPHYFSVKMRLGYENEELFFNIIEMMNQVGIDEIIIHGRTRSDQYRGIGRWDKIFLSAQYFKGKIIGNGDYAEQDQNLVDEQIINEKINGIMVGRLALGNPNFAFTLKNNLLNNIEKLKYENIKFLAEYMDFIFFRKKEEGPLQHFKSLCPYLFKNFPELRSKLLRSETMQDFKSFLKQEI
jgi:tRNA-dihydrouridine synthase B